MAVFDTLGPLGVITTSYIMFFEILGQTGPIGVKKGLFWGKIGYAKKYIFLKKNASTNWKKIHQNMTCGSIIN